MKNGKWKRGINFSQAKYKIINNYSFIPSIRSNFHVSIPREILENFDMNRKNSVVLVEIKDTESKHASMRIKKLHHEGGSFIISFKAEKHFTKPVIRVVKILDEGKALERYYRVKKGSICLKSVIPKETRGGTPIYVIEDGKRLFVGGYYKKDIMVKEEIDLDNDTLSFLGLYFSDGGKTAASFTNSWPIAINTVLDFIEKTFNIDRKVVKSSIYCNPNMKDKKDVLEEFWASETGIENISDKLHFGKNSRSPQGTLELYFCSQIITEILVSILNVINNYSFDRIPMIRGIMSGDGSPLQHTKHSINHHIAFDGKDENLEFLKKSFFGFRTYTLNNRKRFVIKSKWEENRNLIFIDPYRYNPKNRIRFAKNFLLLPKTITSSDKEIHDFKKKQYPLIYKSIKNHYKKLLDLELIQEKYMERIANGFNIC